MTFRLENWAQWQKYLLTKQFADTNVLLMLCGFCRSAKVKRFPPLIVPEEPREHGERWFFSVFSSTQTHQVPGDLSWSVQKVKNLAGDE